jgi:thioredoxin 1
MRIKDMKRHTFAGYILLLCAIFGMSACGHISRRSEEKRMLVSTTGGQPANNTYKVTLIELGSTGCLPCKQMKFIMSSVEKKYGKAIKIEFYDVRTEEGKPYTAKYGISEIPAQIFLDENGKEYFRHIGFFPEEGIVKILQMKGVSEN